MIEQARAYFLASGISRIAGFRAFAWTSLGRQTTSRSRTVHRSTPAIAEPSTHWARLSTVVDQAAQATRLVSELQATAQAKLDVADYALQRLMADLARVMPKVATASATLEPVRIAVPARIRIAA
jgi:hypothetical protein